MPRLVEATVVFLVFTAVRNGVLLVVLDVVTRTEGFLVEGLVVEGFLATVNGLTPVPRGGM